MRIEPISNILPIMPYYPIVPARRNKPPNEENIVYIRDENLGKHVDLTISGSIYKKYKK